MQKAKIFSIALLFVFMLSCQALAENIVEKGLDALKNRIAAELSTLFGREVAIGKISGALLYEADLYDLEIAKGKTLASGRAFYAKKVTITYNPALMAMAKNVLPAIIKIKLEAPDLYIERNEKGEWVAPGITPGGGGEAKIPFTPKISVAEGSITFVDRRGLQKKLPAKPFEIALKGVTGFFDLKKSPDLKLELEGHLAENITSSISAKGSINTSSGVYSIKTDLRSVPASEFIPYLIAIPEIKVNRGALNSTITISGPPKAKGKLPLDIEGDATLFSIGGDVFGYPARDLSGDISILGED
ncbi:MAG: DUF748 domain-containing protein, partial [Candidatus Saganbacteria bacterium]|nr:DUF748 domain-containing protein [Candidatus Saganbacteria bacterium]